MNIDELEPVYFEGSIEDTVALSSYVKEVDVLIDDINDFILLLEKEELLRE